MKRFRNKTAQSSLGEHGSLKQNVHLFHLTLPDQKGYATRPQVVVVLNKLTTFSYGEKKKTTEN